MVFIRFCAVGLLNTTVGLAVIFLLMRVGGMNYIAANLVGYIVGFLISFVLNRNWTFEHKGPILNAALQWTLVVSLAYLVNLSIVITCHQYMGINAYVSQLFGVAAYTILTFVSGRLFVFSSKQI